MIPVDQKSLLSPPLHVLRHTAVTSRKARPSANGGLIIYACMAWVGRISLGLVQNATQKRSAVCARAMGATDQKRGVDSDTISRSNDVHIHSQ